MPFACDEFTHTALSTGKLRNKHAPKLFHHDGTEMRPSIQKLKLRGAVLTQQLDGVKKWVSASKQVPGQLNVVGRTVRLHIRSTSMPTTFAVLLYCSLQDREQWLQKDEARIRAEMRTEREQRRAKDAEFEHLRLLRSGSCTDGSVLRQLQLDKQQQSQQSFDLSSQIDGAAIESESGSFSSLSEWHQASTSSSKSSPSPPRRSLSPDVHPFSPPGSSYRSVSSPSSVDNEQSHSKSRVQLRPDTDRPADDLIRLDREAERYVALQLLSMQVMVLTSVVGCREQSRRRLAGLIELIS